MARVTYRVFDWDEGMRVEQRSWSKTSLGGRNEEHESCQGLVGTGGILADMEGTSLELRIGALRQDWSRQKFGQFLACR